MKILHVLYAGLGGHGNVFFSLVHADKNQEYKYEALFNGVEKVREEYITRCEEYKIPWNYVPKKPGLDFRYYQQLFHYIKQSKADIVFLHSSAYVLPARICTLLASHKPRLIVRETQANHLKTKAEWFWLSVALVMSDQIVFLSEAYRSQIKQRLPWLVNDAKIKVIPNGIDLVKYCRSGRLGKDKILMGMQSRLVEIKDHRTLFAAFKEVCDKNSALECILFLAGDGGTRRQLESYAIELGLKDKIIFTGMLNEKELVEFMQSLDIYIHASFGETMSTAIMQAMACGLPIVASNVDGINNMICDGETGFLVPVENKHALAEKLLMLAENEEIRLMLGKQARQFAEAHFSNKRMYDRYNSLFLAYQEN